MSDSLKGVSRAVVDAKEFSVMLRNVGVVPQKSVLPMLNEVCVRFSGGRCILTATDLQTWVVAELPASGDDLAFVFTKTKEAERMCRYYDGDLTLTLTETNSDSGIVTMSSGFRTGEFDTVPVGIYPEVPELQEDAPAFSVNAAVLLERIKRVDYATSSPGRCSNKSSACVEFADNQVYAVDGRRAACDVSDAVIFPTPFLVQAEQLRLLKLFGESFINLRLSHSQLYAAGGNITVVFTLTQEQPFPLQHVLPQRYVEEFEVSPKEFLSELNYLASATRQNVPLYLRGNEIFLTVQGKKYSTVIDASRQGSMLLSFNLRDITDAIKQFEKEPLVKVRIGGRNLPTVLEAEGRNDYALVLPIRIKQEAAA